jgi:TolB-like protein
MRSKPAPGTVSGARFILLGTVQQEGAQLRLVMRVVVTETGEIIASGKGDTVGGGIRAVFDAARHALPQLGPLNALAA